MKKLVLISLLLAFLFQALSSLVILTTFHLNRDYISDNLCINRFDAIPLCKGSCYLEKKLSETEQQQQELPELKLKGTALFYDDRRVEIDKPLYLPVSRVLFPLFNDAALYEGATSSIFKPPVLMG